MGLISRMSTIFKAKMSKLLDKAENPHETLDYSYHRQLEMLQKVKRNLADMVASKKRLELQVIKLKENANKLEDQARQALKLGREDLATTALERKSAIQQQLEGLEEQIKGLEAEQEKLAAVEAKLQTKVQAFRTKKELLKAQYSAAQAQVKIGEAATGLSEELSDISLAVQRAEEKTENMRARAAAIDELVDTGVLDDALETGDPLERELKKLSASSRVQDDLERLKKEVGQA
ncbi:MAG: PspA/IM30 family protein [Clostridia bacterium]|nr:PspA/IM30 family protein [Clostridia bacterium]